MIEGVYLHIGKVLNEPSIYKGHNLYFLLTEDHKIFYTTTSESLKKGDFIFYFSFSEGSSNEVLYFTRFEDVPIIEAYDRYSYIEIIPEDIDFCIVKFKEDRERNNCTFYINEDYTITHNNNYCQILNCSLTEKEKILILYLTTKKDNKSHTSLYDSLNIKKFKTKEKEIIEHVSKLNISEIINSYTIIQDSYYRKKIGGDDKYEEWLSSKCKYNDAYFSKILPSFYLHYWKHRCIN